MNLSAITEGVITGVCVALALGLWDVWRNARSKREQIEFLRGLILAREAIIKYAEKPEWKKIYYDGLWRDLNSALSHRCTSLPYDKIAEIKKAELIIIETGHPYDPATNNFRPSFIDATFSRLRDIAWLKLPPPFKREEWE